jgi:exonuclease 3'-5' domain-containing protein 1
MVRTRKKPTSPTATHVLVDSIKKSRTALNVIERSVKQSKAVAIDIEGDLRPMGRLSLIQIGLESEAVFLFDVLHCPALLGEDAGLRNFLSGNATKILHDCRNDVAALKGQFNIELVNVWDTQTAHAVLNGKPPRTYLMGLNVILQAYAGESNQNKEKVKHGPGVWEKRPLSALLQVETLKHQQHFSMHYVDILQELTFVIFFRAMPLKMCSTLSRPTAKCSQP